MNADPARCPPSADPARCPLCGADNACAVQTDGGSTRCWCASVEFSAELLARVPEAARRRACICARCAAAGRAGASEPAAQAR